MKSIVSLPNNEIGILFAALLARNFKVLKSPVEAHGYRAGSRADTKTRQMRRCCLWLHRLAEMVAEKS